MRKAMVVVAMLAGPSARGAEVPARVDFDRHVASLFGRLGCNAGACHGSFQGRGGLNLSLFGHDPASDFRAIAKEAQGRRVDRVAPDRSLVLLKATGQVPHEGGPRFAVGSWEYRVIREWIAQGAGRDGKAPGVERVEVGPGELDLKGPGGRGTLAVRAVFADGSAEDVTPYCDLRAKDDGVVEVADDGRVRALRAGETPIIASYRGMLASARAVVPTGRKVEIPVVAGSGATDREVDARLRVLGVPPSGAAGDAEFLRRVTLDVVGRLPTPEEVRAFLANGSEGKRRDVIEGLLADPANAALWATRFLDITGCDVNGMEAPEALRPRRGRMWHDWFRARFAANVPYDAIARGVLLAESRDGGEVGRWLEAEAERLSSPPGPGADYASKPGLDLFWRRYVGGEYFPIEQMAERTATAFLGVRIGWLQCHKHPFDRWTQADYRAYANVFARVKFGHSPEGLAATTRLLEERRSAGPGKVLPPVPRLQEVYNAARPWRRLVDPATGKPLTPKAPGGPEFTTDMDPRAQLVAWLTRPDNPYFARAIVNRVWAAYFGAGLVDPVDGLSVANPPSNPRLLDALAAEFVSGGYDLRALERAILRSRAYQRSSEPVEGNADDRGHFARSTPRVLMAEVMVDALNGALGVPGEFGEDAPKGARAIEVATNAAASPDLARVFRIFGRPERKAGCDCERPRGTSLPQTLFLMTDPGLLAKLRKGRLEAIVASDRCDAEVVEELFLATLSRLPDGEELRAGLDHMRAKAGRREAATDLLWALINTREFVLNH